MEAPRFAPRNGPDLSMARAAPSRARPRAARRPQPILKERTSVGISTPGMFFGSATGGSTTMRTGTTPAQTGKS